MSAIEEQLLIIDEQLEVYEPRQRWFIYLASAIGILLMSWMFFVSDMLDELSMIQESNEALVSKIAQSSPEAYQSKINRVNQEILKKEPMIVDLENEKQAVLFQMSQSQGLIFDNREYAKILDHLLERSVQLGLKIELMQSEDKDAVFYGKVKQFKKLTIKGSGNFRSIASFLQFIESQKCLVQIDSVQIHSEEKLPSFTAVVTYMGVAL